MEQMQSGHAPLIDFQTRLKALNLDFLEEPLRNKVTEFEGIKEGPFSYFILASLARIRRENGEPNEKLQQKAVDTFNAYAKLSAELEKNFTFVSKEKLQFGKTRSLVEIAVRAFRKTMWENKIGYLEKDEAVTALSDNKMDCDLSALMFIQFGRKHGLDLIGVNMPKSYNRRTRTAISHYLTALRESGKVCAHIETTQLLYDPDSVQEHKQSIEENSKKLESIRKVIGELKFIQANGYKETQYRFGLPDIYVKWEKSKVDSALKNNLEVEKLYEGDIERSKEVVSGMAALYYGEEGIKQWERKRGGRYYYTQENVGIFFASELGIINKEPFNFVDRKIYGQTKNGLKQDWETMHNGYTLNNYLYFLILSCGFPGLKPDNEYEIFLLYFQGVKEFGDEILDRHHENILILKEVNMIDYIRAEKEAQKRGYLEK